MQGKSSATTGMYEAWGVWESTNPLRDGGDGGEEEGGEGVRRMGCEQLCFAGGQNGRENL